MSLGDNHCSQNGDNQGMLKEIHVKGVEGYLNCFVGSFKLMKKLLTQRSFIVVQEQCFQMARMKIGQKISVCARHQTSILRRITEERTKVWNIYIFFSITNL